MKRLVYPLCICVSESPAYGAWYVADRPTSPPDLNDFGDDIGVTWRRTVNATPLRTESRPLPEAPKALNSRTAHPGVE